MLLAVMLGVLADSAIKRLTVAYPIMMIVWARYTVHLALVGAALGRRLPTALKSRRPVLQAVRSVAQAGAVVTFVAGLGLVPLADCIAIHFVAPVLITALAAPLLGEQVGVRRWLGVAAGFLGVLIVIRPGTGALSWAALFPLASAVCSAVYQVVTRMVGNADATMTSLAYTALAGTVVANGLLPFVWVVPDVEGWVLMGAVGVLGAMTHYGQIRAYGVAAAAAVAPYLYTGLIWAAAFGYLFFGELPDRWTVLGALVITASGLYVFHRERRAAASRPQGRAG
jgi:drug/metabolite transporter (DMT)-like permease